MRGSVARLITVLSPWTLQRISSGCRRNIKRHSRPASQEQHNYPYISTWNAGIRGNERVDKLAKLGSPGAPVSRNQPGIMVHKIVTYEVTWILLDGKALSCQQARALLDVEL